MKPPRRADWSRSRPAPRAAVWLLERLGPVSKREALLGDLDEQYQRGRSRLWYWRQSLKAIALSVVGDLHRHPASVFHALCTGWGAAVVYHLLFVSPVSFLLQWLALNHQQMRVWFGVIPWVWLPLDLLGGWIVGRTVVRFHRAQLTAALLVLLASGVLIDLPRLFTLSTEAWGYPNYRLQLTMELTTVALMVIGVVVGGVAHDPARTMQADPDTQT